MIAQPNNTGPAGGTWRARCAEPLPLFSPIAPRLAAPHCAGFGLARVALRYAGAIARC